MSVNSPDVEKEFPGLYGAEASRNSDGGSDEGKEEKSRGLMSGKKKDKSKDKGYAALQGESSGEENSGSQGNNEIAKSPSKFPKKAKPFMFSSKKEKKEKSEKRDVSEERKKKSIGSGLGSGKVKVKKKSKDDFDYFLPVFGVPLHKAVERSKCHDGVEIPAVMRECIDYLEETSLGVEGIYRISGTKSKVQLLRTAYNKGERISLEEFGPHVVASLLKLFLRELPESILTVDLCALFEEGAALKDSQRRVSVTKGLLEKLPTANRVTLSWLFVHMQHVMDREEENKMNLQNLALVLSPTLQISHRLLNVFFTHGSDFFAGTVIHRYVRPLSPRLESIRNVPETADALKREIQKQESVLAQIHSELNSGRVDKRKEEQLWEVQRIVTQLKRRLRKVNQENHEEEPQSTFTPPNEFSLNLTLQKNTVSSIKPKKEEAVLEPKQIKKEEPTSEPIQPKKEEATLEPIQPKKEEPTLEPIQPKKEEANFEHMQSKKEAEGALQKDEDSCSQTPSGSSDQNVAPLSTKIPPEEVKDQQSAQIPAMVPVESGDREGLEKTVILDSSNLEVPSEHDSVGNDEAFTNENVPVEGNLLEESKPLASGALRPIEGMVQLLLEIHELEKFELALIDAIQREEKEVKDVLGKDRSLFEWPPPVLSDVPEAGSPSMAQVQKLYEEVLQLEQERYELVQKISTEKKLIAELTAKKQLQGLMSQC